MSAVSWSEIKLTKDSISKARQVELKREKPMVERMAKACYLKMVKDPKNKNISKDVLKLKAMKWAEKKLSKK